MTKKRVLSLVLAVSTSLSLFACSNTSSSDTNSTNGTNGTQGESQTNGASNNDPSDDGNVDSTDTENPGDDDDVDVSEYDKESSEIYDAVFGEFYDYYQDALACENVSKRYALMAIAEAKMLESAVMLPTSTQGGTYAINRAVPYTSTSVLCGTDSERFCTRLITTEPILAEDYNYMKAHWGEIEGTGEYMDWARDYLEEKGYTLKDTYTFTYSTDPATWDTLSSSLAVDAEVLVNTYDGLLEYDNENILQPALAESYEVSDDGLTYTFHIREGVKWVDSQGREVADVQADDWVAGMQHMMDAAGGLEYLVTSEGCGIVNAAAYIGGDITDFSEVGVKAVDEHTLQYTLEAPCSYFTTMLGYSVFAPMSRTYYESMGGKFGVEYDSAAGDYTYGKDSNSIAYCGPYLVTNATEKNTIVFKANESYWNPDRVNVKTLTWLYNDGSDPTKAYNDMKAGTIDGCGLNSSALELARKDGMFDDYAYISSTDATSFMNFYNLNRVAFANIQDGNMASPQTEDDGARTKAAMNNVHFRRAISFALDRGAYNAQIVGEELKYNSLRNTYVPGNFVTLAEDVTVEINGEETSFKAGTAYGVILQAQIDADGVPIKAYDPDADEGLGSSDGYDGWFNVDNAAAEMEKAIEELAADGVEISEDNPIYIDLPYAQNIEIYTNRANAYKQSLEKNLGGKVIVNLLAGSDDDWQNATYFFDYGYEGNYDVNDGSGWTPDYGDPQTYLSTILPDYAGYMTKAMGVF